MRKRRCMYFALAITSFVTLPARAQNASAPWGSTGSSSSAAPSAASSSPGESDASTRPPTTTTTSAAENTLRLRDGTTLRGIVVDLRPGDRVVIATAAGERAVPWVDLERADGPSFPGGYVAVYGAPVAAMLEAARDYTRPRAGRVPLVIESTGPVMALSDIQFFHMNEWHVPTTVGRLLCLTPCTLYVEPARFEFTSAAPGQLDTAYAVNVPRAGLRLRLNGRTVGPVAAGATFSAIGGVGFLVSVAFTIYGGVSIRVASGFSATSGEAFLIGGSIGLGVSAAALVAGIVIIATKRRTIESSGPIPARMRPQVTVGPLSRDGLGFAIFGSF